MNTSKQIEDNTKVRVRQFMNILEQLPKLCSPTICGTLSQPTTRNEREKATRCGDSFEWSLEQRAILSPANITIDSDGTEEWRHLAELSPSRRQQESEAFFSQRTIAPSPLIATPQTKAIASFSQDTNLIYNDDDNDEDQDDDNHVDLDPSWRQQESTNFMYNDEDHDEDNQVDDDLLFFSPQPLKSSQTQQRMDIFSPNTFVRVMEDENTLQSTPKTTGSLLRTRTRADVID